MATYAALSSQESTIKASEAALQVMREDFDKLDTDKSGYLEDKEITQLLKSQLGRDPDEIELKSFLRQVDRNSDNKIGFEEYCAAIWEPCEYREDDSKLEDAYGKGSWNSLQIVKQSKKFLTSDIMDSVQMGTEEMEWTEVVEAWREVAEISAREGGPIVLWGVPFTPLMCTLMANQLESRLNFRDRREPLNARLNLDETPRSKEDKCGLADIWIEAGDAGGVYTIKRGWVSAIDCYGHALSLNSRHSIARTKQGELASDIEADEQQGTYSPIYEELRALGGKSVLLSMLRRFQARQEEWAREEEEEGEEY